MDSLAESESQQPPAKKRRATSDLLREQQLARQAARASQASQPAAKPLLRSLSTVDELADPAAVAHSSTTLVAFSNGEPQANALFAQDSISEELGAIAAHEAEMAEQAARFDAAARHRSKQLEANFRSRLERRDSKVGDEPVLTPSATHITADFCVKSGLHLATPHGSFKWLRHLPPALRRGADSAQKEAVRGAVLAVCKEHLPSLMGNPEKATEWMEKLCACLVWFEVEGPLRISTPTEQAPSAVPEERSAIRRVEEWDEAFRSLQVLLRQGLISSYVIATERFTVTIFGEGAGPWESAQSGDTQKPSQDCPCAVLCPSQVEIRSMLQDSHVAFDIADISQKSKSIARRASEPAGTESATTAIVPIDPAMSTSLNDNQADLRDLRRGGERVVTPDEMSRVKPASTALLFEGAWRVHGMLDVLRQFLLDAPVPSAPESRPPRLPRLIAPMSFSHAAVHSAEVVKTQTLKAGSAAAAASAAASADATAPAGRDKASEDKHMVELSGCFFPGQVRRLLELLRVPLPSFTCRLAAEPRHSTGINAFTQLGMYRLEGVRCERLPVAEGSERQWNWEFELAGG